VINIAGVTFGNELIAESSILNSSLSQETERERERETERIGRRRGGVRVTSSIIRGGGESEKFPALKAPRQCPLVHLVNVCW
jgi:hypothetical protein